MKGYANGFSLTLQPGRLHDPEARRKPARFFVSSMSDLFHESVPDDFLGRVFRAMTRAPQHTFQVLTKRAERMASFFEHREVPSNAWLGVTAEDRRHGLPRIQLLRKIDARLRFVSMEPLLEDIGEIDLDRISWVIVGGESGSKARPMRAEWVTSVKRQCDEQGIEFFFKQWGAWGSDGVKRGKKANGRLFLGRTWDGFPAVRGQLL